MAATQSQAPDPTTEEAEEDTEVYFLQDHSTVAVWSNITGRKEKPAEPDNMKEPPLSVKNETSVSRNASQDAVTIGHPRDSTGQPGLFGSPGDRIVYQPSAYAPQAQAFYYRGEWNEYPSYVNTAGLESGSAGLYNDNPSLVFHAGYGYGPQMLYGPYSPATTPLPDAQLYSPQQFPFSTPPYYQQLGHPNMSYVQAPTPVSQPELNTLVSIDQHGDNMLFGPRPSYPSPLGSFGRDSFPGNLGALGFHDMQHGVDGLRSGGLWSDWSKPSDRHRPLTPLSPVISSQPAGPFGSFGHNVGMEPQQQRSFYGLEPSPSSYNRAYVQSGYNHSRFGSASLSSLGGNNRGWLSLENSRRHGTGSISLCGCNGSVGILSEQNRGPRASKPKSQSTIEYVSSVDNKHSKSAANTCDESYNQVDFVTEYNDARFFIIKSYSEDNVHKSIKYGVWASTPNGNRKLDAAYRESKEKHDPSPVFLFFSVNASAQFCGVAEMVGPVDFDKSVDYWQQDKWSGQFPVKWHIIKDVPNSQFRHIVLENNDNKPVTNSRDTQEVKLEQGIEMLKIFKNHETEMSILDDFEFYEDRENAMQERKARQQASLMVSGLTGENEHRNTVTLPTDFVKQVSKSFAQVVRVDDPSKEGAGGGRASSGTDASIGLRVKVEDAIAAVPSVKMS